MGRISEMTKWEKFNMIKKYPASDWERTVLARYLKAIWLNDIETQRYFEEWGETVVEIARNVMFYEKSKNFGTFPPQYINTWRVYELKRIETIDIAPGNLIAIGQGPNGKFTYGYGWSTRWKCGGISLSVLRPPYDNLLDVYKDSFEALEKDYKTELNHPLKEHRKRISVLQQIVAKKRNEYLNRQLTLNFDF